MKIHTDTIQGSEEWAALRRGKATGSIAATIQAKGRGGGKSLTREAEMLALALERVHGKPRPEGFKSVHMINGTETEPLARRHYEIMEGAIVQQVGFVELNEDVGASPDGLVGDDGVLEIKCPKDTTQYRRYNAGVFPTDYEAQVQFLLWVTDRKWCDFVSYAPRMEAMKYFKVRVPRDQLYIDNLKLEVDKFVRELKELTAVLISNQPY